MAWPQQRPTRERPDTFMQTGTVRTKLILAPTGRTIHFWEHVMRDYEQRFDVSEAFIHVAMGNLLLRRINHRVHSQRTQ